MSSTCKRSWLTHNASSATRSADSLGTSAGEPGKSFPLGATLVPGGANFSVFAKHSTSAQLLLFDDADAPSPSRVVNLDPKANRTYHYWHVFVPAVTAGQIYAYRVAGPVDPAEDCVSALIRCCSTLMGNASPGPRGVAGRPHVVRVTMPLRR
jgi:1,4-alpha-glucan branching enzyme